MKNNVKLKGRLKSYLQSSLYLGFLLMAVDVLIYMIDYRAGLVLSAFLILYIAIILSMMFYNKPIIMNELISFATQYGQIQRRLLRDLELPHALLDDGGKIIWTNIAFERLVHQEKGYRKSLLFSLLLRRTSFQGGMRRTRLSLTSNMRRVIILRNSRRYPLRRWHRTVIL